MPKTSHAIPNSDRKYSKAKALAARLGICPKTIARWAADGKISRFKVNDRVVLFDETEVFQFVEGTRVQN